MFNFFTKTSMMKQMLKLLQLLSYRIDPLNCRLLVSPSRLLVPPSLVKVLFREDFLLTAPIALVCANLFNAADQMFLTVARLRNI